LFFRIIPQFRLNCIEKKAPVGYFIYVEAFPKHQLLGRSIIEVLRRDFMKNHRNRMFFGVMALVTGLALVSCGDFFSQTWGEGFARDPSNVKVSESNVKDLLQDANGDPEASRAILEKLKGTENPALQAAAVKAANQASGLTQIILSNLDTLTKDTNDTGALEILAQTVLNEAKNNGIVAVAGTIADTLSVTVTEDSVPVFEGSFVKSVPTSDLTILLVTMMMAEAVELNDDFSAYADKWENKSITNAADLGPRERLIAATANEVIARGDGNLSDMLKNLVREE
jgi:hypothetical protein